MREESVFPMHVGVFPLLSLYSSFHFRLPHARGGVFLFRSASMAISSGLPHARGGVSCRPVDDTAVSESSPCTWGCFLLTILDKISGIVFPMHVGVFLIWWFPPCAHSRLPHARGGVSIFDSVCCRHKKSSPCTWGCFSSVFQS